MAVAHPQAKWKMEPMSNRLLTPHQRQFWAWLLQRKAAGGSMESLAGTLVDAQVDLNPHQIEAALFACQNPLAKGVLLADEVGLGKTIEAGLVISQRWAERRRRILIIVPANLRKQWHQELLDKFGLEAVIDREIKDVRRSATGAATLDEKLSWQKRQRDLEVERNRLRRERFDRQDEVDRQRSGVIEQLESQLAQRVDEQTLFTVEWELA